MIIPVTTTPVQLDQFSDEDIVLLVNEGPDAIRFGYSEEEAPVGVLMAAGAGVITNRLAENFIWVVAPSGAAQVSAIRVQ